MTKPLPEYVRRMKEEETELAIRVCALEKFCYAEGTEFENLSRSDQVEACKQLGFMKAYHRILDTRIWTVIRNSNG